MIEPNMATMLSFIETDVSISTANIKKYLNYFSNLSFNRISVDGDMSTNDTVVFSSTGDISLDLKNKSVQRKFLSFASEFFVDMASLIVKDGEGATKAVKLNVINSKSLDLAQKVAKKISNSLLVKTAVFGEDPNWGRVMASLGSIQSDYIKPDKVKLLINNILCFTNGLQTKGVTSRLKKSMKNKRIEITINLNNGKYNETMYFCDLSHDYVKINSEYTT